MNRWVGKETLYESALRGRRAADHRGYRGHVQAASPGYEVAGFTRPREAQEAGQTADYNAGTPWMDREVPDNVNGLKCKTV